MLIRMKNSGIEWVGDIPNHWKIERMKACIALREGGVWGEEETGDNDTICLRVADFDYDRFVFKNTSISALTKRHYRKSIVAKLRLLKGDIVIEKSGGGERTPVGRAVIFDKDYVALFANFMDRLRCGAFVYPKFMLYIFATFYKNQYTRNYIKQTIGIQNLDLSLMLNKEHVPMPPLSEQKAIAELLDKKCGEVDALIADIQQEIETLEQYKRSVITEAVTKGLDPSVPMKDSGIDWIGDIPEHWKVSKLKYLFKTVSGNGFNIDLQGEESGDYPFCKASDISIANKDLNKAQNYVTEQVARLNRYNIIPQGSIIFAKIGEAMKKNNRAICRCACCIDNNCQALIPLSVINDIYSYYLLKCVDMQWFDNAGTIPCISIRKLMNSSIVFPSLLEQKAIVTFLDKKCKEIEEVIADKQLQIETLESYKKSLIYEYVTGKKEVG